MKKRVLSFLITGIFLLVGCQNIDDYRRERIEKADIAFKKIQDKKFPENVTLTLPFCVELALKHNLDLKVYELKEAVNKERKTAAVLGMLPDLTVTNDVTQRSNEPGASSYNITTGQQNLPYSKSSQPFENRVRVELLFSVIDFGLAFCNSVQQQDRAIITTEQKRRAAQNLILDVTRSYLRVAAAQYAMETTEKMISLSVETENLLESMAKNKTVPLIRVLEENKKFIVLKKALMEYKRSYHNSCIELRSLMGYYPTHEIKVDTSAMDKLTELNIPDIELLEEAALLERPELYQLDIQTHITLMEARKTIIMMFPNVRVFTDFTSSTNPFLYNHSWWELGARASYHLLRIPQQIAHYYALEEEEGQLKAQTMALSVGILAQVRIAHANLIEVKERYNLAEDLFEVYKKHEDVAEIHSKSAGSLSKIELSRIKIETAQRAIERTQTLGNYYLSYFRLLNAIGLNSLDKEDLEQLKNRIEESINETIKGELDNAADYKAEIAEIQLDIDEFNTEITNYELQITNLNDELKNSTDKLNSLSSSSESAQGKIKKGYSEKLSVLNYTIITENREIAKLNAERSDEKSKLAQLNNLSKEERNGEAISERENRIDTINDKISLSRDNIKTANDRIGDINSDMKDALKDSETLFSNKIDALKESVEETNDRMAGYNDEITEYQTETQSLEKEKAEVTEKLDESVNTTDGHYKRLKKYTAAIETLKKKQSDSGQRENKLLKKYDKVMNLPASGNGQRTTDNRQLTIGQETLSGQTARSISNLNMEMQQSSKSNTVTPEEYTPGKANNIIVEAQKDAANNTIDQESFNPMTQDNITLQTMKDADNNLITGEGYNANLKNQEDVTNNQIQEQMNQSMVQPGRDGN